MYRLGCGVKADDLCVRAWCYLAAKRGHEDAQTALGHELFFDHIVPTNEKETWLKRAARRKDPDSVAYLGILAMHCRESGRKLDVKLGLSRLEKAAAMGSTFAMLRLGELYLGKLFSGYVTIDRDQAQFYFMAATDAGEEDGIKQLRKEFKVKYDGRSAAKPIKKASPKSRVHRPRKPATNRIFERR